MSHSFSLLGSSFAILPIPPRFTLFPYPTLFRSDTLRTVEARARLRALRPDLMVVVAYGLLLPQKVLDIPVHGCWNVHASLLPRRSEEHTSELQSRENLVCRLLLEKKKTEKALEE